MVNSSYKLVQIQVEGKLVGYSRKHIKYIRNYPPYWRSFLHLQLENAKCRGETTTSGSVKWIYNLIIQIVTDLILK